MSSTTTNAAHRVVAATKEPPKFIQEFVSFLKDYTIQPQLVAPLLGSV